MYVEKDYIMRIIHEVIRTLFKLLCNADIDSPEKDRLPPEVEAAFEPWKRMIDSGQINEAENLLVDGRDQNSRCDFLCALLFYEYLNQKDESFLKAHQYTREEIREGLRDAVYFFGYESMMEAFLEDLGETEDEKQL